MILIGGGGHAFSIAEFASDEIKGYLALEPNLDFPFEWRGTDDERAELAKQGHTFHIAYVYSGLPEMKNRRKLIEKYSEAGCVFKTIVAPTAIVTSHSDLGAGSSVMQGAIINRARIGCHCIINSGAIIEHDCIVGDNTFIGPGAVVGGFTTIGENCFIGLGVKIGNGLHISDNVTIAIGAVVNRDIDEPGIYHGNPLRRFKG